MEITCSSQTTQVFYEGSCSDKDGSTARFSSKFKDISARCTDAMDSRRTDPPSVRRSPPGSGGGQCGQPEPFFLERRRKERPALN